VEIISELSGLKENDRKLSVFKKANPLNSVCFSSLYNGGSVRVHWGFIEGSLRVHWGKPN